MSGLSSNFLVHGVYITIDNSKANAGGVENFRTLLFGQKLSAGTATDNVPIQVFSGEQAGYFGVGSNLAEMLDQIFLQNAYGEVWVCPVEDASAGTQAAWTLTVTGPATASGTIYFYCNGDVYPIGVSTGDTVSTILTAIQTMIAAHPELPITAGTPESTTITITAKHKGTIGNQIQIGFNQVTGNKFPKGVAVTKASTNSGATDPTTIQTAIAAIPDTSFDLWLFPWSDSTTIGYFTTELSGRWSNLSQLYGVSLTQAYGSASTVEATGSGLNSQYVAVLDTGTNPVSAPYQEIANAAGIIAPSLEDDPALTLQTLPLTGIIGDGESTRRTIAQNQSILSAGVSTLSIDRAGDVSIGRMVTTYKTNSSGVIDHSYQDLTTMFLLAYLSKSLRSFCATTYARCKLANDGWAGAPGQKVATPSSIKADLVTWMRQEEYLGHLEAITDDVITNTTVTRDSTNRNMVHAILAPNLINNLITLDATIQFVL